MYLTLKFAGTVLIKKGESYVSRRKLRTAKLDVYLRTPHVHYLEYLAEQTGTSLSDAFGAIIDKHAALALITYIQPHKPPRKVEKHLSIEPAHAEILNKLATQQGLRVADIARRVIEEAMSRDGVV